MHYAKTRSERKKNRVRLKIKKSCFDKPRLSVFRSNRHMYAQVILGTRTLAAASSIESDLVKGLSSTSTVEAAGIVGKIIAQRALKAGVEEVVFDRGEYAYHGRVAELAKIARDAGLKF
jgi:large subunit ribosomal protein L18